MHYVELHLLRNRNVVSVPMLVAVAPDTAACVLAAHLQARAEVILQSYTTLVVD
jgi:hypothetical protein